SSACKREPRLPPGLRARSSAPPLRHSSCSPSILEWAVYDVGAMSGRSFLQIPGPTNIPDRVLRAMDRPVIDHRSPEFAQLTEDARVGLRKVFGTVDGSPMLYPASGTGATEAALVNVLQPGDRVLSFNYGMFSGGMGNIARRFGYQVDEVPLRWGQA